MPVTSATVASRRTRRLRQRAAEAPANPSLFRASSAPASFSTYILAAALMTSALVFFVYLRVGTLRLGYLLSDSRQEQMQLVLENRALKTEIGMLSSPARIRSLAVEKLGMVPAERFVRLGAAQ